MKKDVIGIWRGHPATILRSVKLKGRTVNIITYTKKTREELKNSRKRVRTLEDYRSEKYDPVLEGLERGYGLPPLGCSEAKQTIWFMRHGILPPLEDSK